MNRREVIFGIAAGIVATTNTFTPDPDLGIWSEELRRIERLEPHPTQSALTSPTWSRVRLSRLRNGDVFRMFDKDYQVGGEGAMWRATSNPYIDQSGVWGIEAKQLAEKI